MATALFVSDIHIASPECPRGRLFLKFLRSLSARTGATHLYLLGDIFDLWVADHRYFTERFADIVGEIRRLHDEGVEIGYFEGNHDLHLRRFWGDELGVAVYTGPAYLQLGETTLRIEHGDQMDPDDTGYRFLRWFLRTPPVRWLICNLPGRLIARIGEKASASSREYTSNTKTIDRDSAIRKIREHADRACRERPFDLLLTGHVHVRDDYVGETGTHTYRSVNLGCWMDRPCYFKLDENEQHLHELTQQ